MVDDRQRNNNDIANKAKGIRELLDTMQIHLYKVSEYTGKREASQEKSTSDYSSASNSSGAILTARQLHKRNMATWNRIKEELKEDNAHDILNYEFERIVTVFKDILPSGVKQGGHDIHRKYKARDTLLDMLLRHNPPYTVLTRLATILPVYEASRELFRIVEKTHLADDSWDEFMMKFNELTKEKTAKGYGLDTDQMHRVFLIRHTWREDTILSLCARRNPPLRVIDSISNACRVSVCIVDCRKWDWIPMQYAIAYHARPEVVEALIPTEEDRDSLIRYRHHSGYHYCTSYDDSCEESSVKYDLGISVDDTRDILFKPDYHYRTPLHWAAYYDAPLETIQSLKNACSQDVLHVKDHCGHEPYKTAIWHGRSTIIIEAFFTESLHYEKFEDILVKLIRSLIYVKEEAEGSGDGPSRDGTYTYEHFDLASISAHIANSPPLQKIIGMKSCDPLPSMVILADFYSCVLLIIGYHISSRNFLTGRDVTSSVWFGITVVAIFYTALREMMQIFVEHVRWFLSSWNYLDVATIVFVVISLFQMWLEGGIDSGNSSATLVVVTTALVWLNAIFFLRSTFMSFATFVGGIFKIISDLIPFIVVSALILMAFGEMFSLDMLGEQGECKVEGNTTYDATDFCSFGDSLFITYGLFVGGIELDAYANAETRMRAIAVVFGFLVAIILLNVLIVIVGNSWNEVVQNGKEVFWAYRLGFLIEVKGYESFWCNKKLKIFWWNNKLTRNQRTLDKFLLFWDQRLSDLCELFWPSKSYWGNFDSIFDRFFMDSIGSLRWQCIYESRTTWYKRILMGIKVVILLLIFGTIASVWFILGLATFGLLWPHPIRRYVLASAVEKDEPESTKQEVVLQAIRPNSPVAFSSVHGNGRPFTARSSIMRPPTAIMNTTNNSTLRKNILSTIEDLHRLLDQIPEDNNTVVTSAAATHNDNLSYVSQNSNWYA